MGRIKTRKIKRVSKELMAKYKDELTESYEDNKAFISDKVQVSSKKLRNIIAGYLARLKKGEMKV
ncbi:MAG: 30S ribosomal protein S17e [Candidatus Woesearchaeota archaeon]